MIFEFVVCCVQKLRISYGKQFSIMINFSLCFSHSFDYVSYHTADPQWNLVKLWRNPVEIPVRILFFIIKLISKIHPISIICLPINHLGVAFWTDGTWLPSVQKRNICLKTHCFGTKMSLYMLHTTRISKLWSCYFGYSLGLKGHKKKHNVNYFGHYLAKEIYHQAVCLSTLHIMTMTTIHRLL